MVLLDWINKVLYYKRIFVFASFMCFEVPFTTPRFLVTTE